MQENPTNPDILQRNCDPVGSANDYRVLWSLICKEGLGYLREGDNTNEKWRYGQW